MLPINNILRVIFDTNLLVAAARSRQGASYQLISLLPSSKFKLIISLPLYFEYIDVQGFLIKILLVKSKKLDAEKR